MGNLTSSVGFPYLLNIDMWHGPQIFACGSVETPELGVSSSLAPCTLEIKLSTLGGLLGSSPKEAFKYGYFHGLLNTPSASVVRTGPLHFEEQSLLWDRRVTNSGVTRKVCDSACGDLGIARMQCHWLFEKDPQGGAMPGVEHRMAMVA